jgi:hypothetical protein
MHQVRKKVKSKDSFYEEFEQVSITSLNIILLGDNAKVGREKIFKPTIGQESLHQDRNDNGIRLVNF